MDRPNECKWCGCGSVYSVSDRHVKFTCRSAWTADGDCWACSSQCCDGMRDRIRRAVEVLERAERYDFIASYMPHMDKRSDGEFMEYEQADQVIEILKGETDGQAE